MSWYDYIPIVGSIAEAAQGNWGHAAADLAGPVGAGIYDNHQANGKLKQGFYDASNQAQDLSNLQWNRQMEGLGKAQAYYEPARARMRAAYGDPNSVTK